MTIILPILTSVVSAMLVFILQSVIKENRKLKADRERKFEEREAAIEEGMVCLLRVQLIEYHAKYMEKDYITTHALQNWLQMYKAYHILGGNGMVDHLKEEIEELHIK